MPKLELTSFAKEIKLKESFKSERKAERKKVLINELLRSKAGTQEDTKFISDNFLECHQVREKIGFFDKRIQEKYHVIKSAYLNEDKQIKRHLLYEEGTFIRKIDKSIVNDQYIYVIDTDGNIIAARAGIVKHHSFLANGKPVKAAGFLTFDNGKLIAIDNDSGHYKPTREEMMDVLFALTQLIPEDDLSDCRFIDHSEIASGIKSTYSLVPTEEAVKVPLKLEPVSIEDVKSGTKVSPIDLDAYHEAIEKILVLLKEGLLDEAINVMIAIPKGSDIEYDVTDDLSGIPKLS